MIHHKFTRQRSDRRVSARLVNQTLDDVRRLAISTPGPGFGGIGAAGGLLQFKNSTDFFIGYTDADGISAAEPDSESGPNATLGKGLAFPIYVSTDEAGEATTELGGDTASQQTIYNLYPHKVPGDIQIRATKRWNLWIVDPPSTDIFQAKTPEAGVDAATGDEWPYTPEEFESNVVSLDGAPILVAEAAKIWNGLPLSLPGGKIVLVKSNVNGSYSVINQVC